MISYEEALKRALEVDPEINYYSENKSAFIFSVKDAIQNPLCIIKETGELLNMLDYIKNYEYEEIISEGDIVV